jgi:hypothetical protein
MYLPGFLNAEDLNTTVASSHDFIQLFHWISAAVPLVRLDRFGRKRPLFIGCFYILASWLRLCD